MPTIKLTSKRQATFPVEVCNALNLHPGDEVDLDLHVHQGEKEWVLRPKHSRKRAWLEALRQYSHHARGDHSMKAIRQSIERGRA